MAGLLSLSLIPAIRKGSAYLSENGTPWKWPLYPWTVFGFLAVAVVGRSYYLSISFDEASGSLAAMYSAFGLYHLIPLALGVLLVVLEIGIVERNESIRKNVLILAALTPVLAIPFRLYDPTYTQFHAEFSRTLAAPLFLSVLGPSCLFFVYAWLRGVREAEAGIVVMLLLSSVVGPGTTTLGKVDGSASLASDGALRDAIRTRRGSEEVRCTASAACCVQPACLALSLECSRSSSSGGKSFHSM